MASVRFKGEKKFADLETGEVFDAQVVARSVDGDTNFDKIWLGTILEVVEEIGSKKMRVLLWLIANRDAKNIVRATKDEIASATGTGRTNVTELLAALRRHDVLSEVRRSVWRLNPDVIWKGSAHTRMRVLFDYRDERAEAQRDLFADAPAAEPAPEELPPNVHSLNRAA